MIIAAKVPDAIVRFISWAQAGAPIAARMIRHAFSMAEGVPVGQETKAKVAAALEQACECVAELPIAAWPEPNMTVEYWDWGVNFFQGLED